MNIVAQVPQISVSLPALVERAAAALSSAKTAAEILDARDMAAVAIDAAKRAARIAKVRQAADEWIAAAYRAEADAHEIQALAKRRLADEYDAAQERGEVQRRGGDETSKAEVPTVAAIGLTHKEIHEGRQIRDAEEKDPGTGAPQWSGSYPPGFSSRGRRTGWHGSNVPPGWSKGRKKGWNGANVPPGLMGR